MPVFPQLTERPQVKLTCRSKVCESSWSSYIVVSAFANIVPPVIQHRPVQHTTDFRLIFHRNVHVHDSTHATQVLNTLFIARLFWTCSCKKTLASFNFSDRFREQYCCGGNWARSKHEVSHNSSSGACTQVSRDADSEKKAKRIQTDPLYEFAILRPSWLLTTSQKMSQSSDRYL